MTKLILKQLTLIYFKGIINKAFDFNNTTSIYGDNGTGKTTIFDAFTWLLFGKDSQGNSDSKFDIKTLNSDNSVIEKQDHEVHAVLDYNGQTLKLSRVLREKWEKKRGDVMATFTGHETICFFDEIPVSITEFNNRVGQIINESLFRLITNPLYFNSLNWKDRRNVLMEMAGEVSVSETFDKICTLGNKEQMGNLINLLNSGKSIEDLKAKTAQQKKTINDQLKQIPTRIDQTRKCTPESIDFSLVEKSIESRKKEMSVIDEQMADRSKAMDSKFKSIDEKRGKISSLKNRQSVLVSTAQQEEQKRVSAANLSRSQKESDLRIATGQYESLKNELFRAENDLSIQGKITAKENAISIKRDSWNTENEKEYQAKEGCLICPVYGHECSDDDAMSKHINSNETARNSFHSAKQTRLSEITSEGQQLSKELEALKVELLNHNNGILSLKTDVSNKKQLVDQLTNELSFMPVETAKEIISADIPEWLELYDQIKAIEPTIETVESVYNSDLIERKKAIEAEIDSLKSQLSDKEVIERNNIQIGLLQEEEKLMAQEVSQLEGTEFAIQEFTKAQMEEIDRRVNGKFKYVKFKLFEKQINGSEIECCQTIVNGVPFGTGLNNAACINAGIDIINALCEKNNVSAPIFIDNRESVNELIQCDSQIINLIVSNHKQLTIK